MSPIVPSLPPHLIQLGFDHILAVEAGDDVQAARLAHPRCDRTRKDVTARVALLVDTGLAAPSRSHRQPR
ncbi:hypothetical protein QF037_009635 [Streptomyces canus]|nr:hypothetical protein [Streptomyces canus]